MSSFFGSDGSFSLQFAIIFAVIFVILAIGVFALRSLSGKGLSLSPKAGPRGRQPRLGIVDIYELDRQRQLILLRRDNVEHLLLVGGPNDVVIERNITRGASARLSGEDVAETEVAPPAPDFGQPPAAVPYLEPQREPTFEMPVVVPAPVPGSDTAPPPVGRPLDLSAGPDTYGAAARPDPAPAVAPPRRESPLARVVRRAPPPLANLVPGAGGERVRLPEAAYPSSGETVSNPPPVPVPGTARAVDAAILSDMARQLEEALRRPAAAVRPAASPAVPVEHETTFTPAPAEPASEHPVPEATAFVPASEPEHRPEPQPEPEIDPIAAAMAATSEPAAAEAVPEPEPLSPEASAPAPLPQEPEPVAHEVVETPTAASDASASTEPSPAVPAALEPEPTVPSAPVPAAKPAAKAAASPNPFSVEEIEAEFARLLGRPLDRKG